MKTLHQQFRILRSRLRAPGLLYVTDSKDWSIRQDGLAITGGLKRLHPSLRCELGTNPGKAFHQIVHFGSMWAALKNIDRTHRSNRLVATIFHGRKGLDAKFDRSLDTFIGHAPRLDSVVTACTEMGERLEQWGVDPKKIRIIPLGIDLARFAPVENPAERLLRRREFGIPHEAVCIGSFQKDGSGWGEGMEPKWIKGPDVFVAAVSDLANRHPVHVLLTGPARGYVKAELQRAGVPFTHTYLPDFADLPRMFGCLDLYLITSREEGGPKAILECMASGVPFVSTRVGMAPDLIRAGENGVMVDVDDLPALVAGADRILSDPDHRRRLVYGGLRTARDFDWLKIAAKYYDSVYAPLLNRR
jgi:glycosyltransferase involved in cell wall biosynthesis